MSTRENDRNADAVDDLSDVIPIGVTIAISDGVHEMKFGRRICEIQGYGENGWTTEQMLDYFQDLCRVYDAWAESKSPWIIPENYEDLCLPEAIRSQDYNTWQSWHELRDFVSKAYDAFVPRTMSEILGKLNVTIEQWILSICSGNRTVPIISAETLGEIERFYTALEHPYPIKDLMGYTDYSRGTLENIGKLFAKRRLALHGEQARNIDKAPAMLRHLVAEGNHTNAECLRIVERETGVKFSRSYVSKIRQRQYD